MTVKTLLVFFLSLVAASAQIYKNPFTTSPKPMVPGYALTAVPQTNATHWASNIWGKFPLPAWKPSSMGNRPTLFGQTNDPIITLRYAGVQPNGVDEGPNDNVIYIGDNSPAGKDAISLQMRNLAGRLTFVFDDDLFTWRFQATNMTYAFSDSGLNWSIISVNNVLQSQVPVSTFGITNPVGLTFLQSSDVVVKASSTSVGIYFQTNNTAANGSIYLDPNGILWKRTNATWVIR